MPSEVTFDVDSSAVKPQFRNTLNDVASTLVQYESTYIDVYGHTDSTGSDAYNQTLSERRAQSVSSYLSTPRRAERTACHARLRRIAAGGVEHHRRWPRAEPPRRNPHRSGYPGRRERLNRLLLCVTP